MKDTKEKVNNWINMSANQLYQKKNVLWGYKYIYKMKMYDSNTKNTKDTKEQMEVKYSNLKIIQEEVQLLTYVGF